MRLFLCFCLWGRSAYYKKTRQPMRLAAGFRFARKRGRI